jgi:hypothetical protein
MALRQRQQHCGAPSASWRIGARLAPPRLEVGINGARGAPPRGACIRRHRCARAALKGKQNVTVA